MIAVDTNFLIALFDGDKFPNGTIENTLHVRAKSVCIILNVRNVVVRLLLCDLPHLRRGVSFTYLKVFPMQCALGDIARLWLRIPVTTLS